MNFNNTASKLFVTSSWYRLVGSYPYSYQNLGEIHQEEGQSL